MYLSSKYLSFIKEKLYFIICWQISLYLCVEDAKELFAVLVKVLSFELLLIIIKKKEMK